MSAATGARKSVSVHDYPEHLNPFHEDDNHNKIRFWTIGRKLNRTNSISFSGIKDLKNSWAFRSFMKKGKKGHQSSTPEKPNQVNGEHEEIVYRRAIQYSSGSVGARNTVGSPERTDRYVYGGSVTPLPRSRFQERLRSASQHEVNSISVTPRLARSEVSGSRISVESTNPFDEGPVPPVRASRRKKKRAAPLPPSSTTAADISITSETSDLQVNEVNERKIIENTIKGNKPDENKSSETKVEDRKDDENKTEANKLDENKDGPGGDLDIEEMNINIELKIVEDEDLKDKGEAIVMDAPVSNDRRSPENIELKELKVKEIKPVATEENEKTTNSGSEDDILKAVALPQIEFPKVDIAKYRRNSSVNEDDIKLRRGNLEDFHTLTNRSKSLTNTSNTFITYDINLNEDISTKDKNGNDEIQKVICKLSDTPRKLSVDNSISSTEREFIEIDKVRREFEREINKLNAALEEDFSTPGNRLSVSDIRKKFDTSDVTSPNPIPKPRRSQYGGSSPPMNGNVHHA